MRSLETIKRTASASKLDVSSKAAKVQKKEKIPTTGIFAPQQLGEIASKLKGSRIEFEEKRPHICPVDKCKMRYVYRKALEAHMVDKHKGFPFPPLPIVEATGRGGAAAGVRAAAGGGGSADAVDAPLLPPS